MKAVFGLGNPGRRYTLTRHNVGFAAVDLYRKVHRLRRAGRIQGDCIVYRTDDLLLCKPLTYMNESGSTVAAVLARHGISLQDTLIIYDELDLPLGRVKILAGGGPGTHKGMKSVVSALGTTEIPRLRIGIEVEERTKPGESFVLEKFTPDEWARVVPALECAVDAIDLYRTSDLEAVMTRFNRRDEPGCRS